METLLGALTPHIEGLGRKLQNLFPAIKIVMQDERFTSVQAKEALLQSGIGQKKRRDKGLVDKMAATILLQEYLEHTKYRF
ncbi:MAG: Holliday junction resolvase RuvX [Saprospiraceae bacterium]